jgi:Domain of unknown function (DUF1818)
MVVGAIHELPLLPSLKFMQKVLKSGAGWRIGWKPSSKYQGLVGGDDWAFELTADELSDFCRLLGQLVANMRSIQAELMDEERIACEAESELLWMQLAGISSKCSLRLILNTGRSCEGNWVADAVPELVAAVDSLKFF